ncbi:ECF transporter S component [Secundilactobacillus yichangensis]|uniref:ECF transporter S component n=1 Tax=Secundilactobacillus yichangensis TaxID=2799580 RepID=UPI00194573B3|nr:ECF transporter S component [Secundilactobacillus yichangensis]
MKENGIEHNKGNRFNMWKIHLSVATVTLIPAAVGINYVAKAFAEGLKLPLWLGSLGTYLASMLAGPTAGAISGFINNIIYGLTLSPVSTVYSITSIAIGIVVGVLFNRGWFSSAKRVFVSAILIALTSAIISTPLNVIFWGGQTGIPWGDAIFAGMIGNHINIWIASFTDEFILDIMDKVVVAYIAFFIYKQLPQRMINYFKDNQ